MFNYLLRKSKRSKVFWASSRSFSKKKSIIYFGGILNRKNSRSRRLWKDRRKGVRDKVGWGRKERGEQKTEWEVSRGWNRGTNESVTCLEGSNRHGELQWTSLLRYLSRFVPFHFQCPGTRKPRPPWTKVRLRLLVVRVSRSKRTRGATVSSPVPSSLLSSILLYFAS